MKALFTALAVPFLLMGFALNGTPEYPVDDDPALVDLGRYLFFDPRLSGDGSISCATCHDPEHAWGDGEADTAVA